MPHASAATVGNRITPPGPIPDPTVLARLANVPTPDISDAMLCSGTMDRQIAPMIDGIQRVAGRAITISIPTISMKMLRAGFELAEPGDVIVVNAMNASTSAVVGGNMLRRLRDRGIAAIIIDGRIRDITEARAIGLPVFATGIATATGPEGPDVGEVNGAIACGKVVVNSGDIVVADGDGVVIISQTDAASVLAKLKSKP